MERRGLVLDNVTRTIIRVRYQETDQMRFVYHSNYITWFDIGRTEWFRHYGTSYRELEAEGLILPVVRVECDYIKPAVYDDECVVETRLHSFSGVKMRFHYRITRLVTGELLAEGATENAFINQQGKPIRLARVKPELAALLTSKAN